MCTIKLESSECKASKDQIRDLPKNSTVSQKAVSVKGLGGTNTWFVHWPQVYGVCLLWISLLNADAIKCWETAKVKPMNYWSWISNNLLYTHQKDSWQTRSTQTKTSNDFSGYIVTKQLVKAVTLLFKVIGNKLN